MDIFLVETTATIKIKEEESNEIRTTKLVHKYWVKAESLEQLKDIVRFHVENEVRHTFGYYVYNRGVKVETIVLKGMSGTAAGIICEV